MKHRGHTPIQDGDWIVAFGECGDAPVITSAHCDRARPRLRRWDDPEVSWDDRARVAEQAHDDFSRRGDCKRRWATITPAMQGQEIADACLSVERIGTNQEDTDPDGWDACVRRALRAEGFEVPE